MTAISELFARKAKVEKGCGNKQVYNQYNIQDEEETVFSWCSKHRLCPKCKAELLGLNLGIKAIEEIKEIIDDDIKEMKKLIPNKNDKNQEDYFKLYSFTEEELDNNVLGTLVELKSQLNKEQRQ